MMSVVTQWFSAGCDRGLLVRTSPVTLIVLGLTEGMIEVERSGSVVQCWMRSRFAGLNLASDTYCAGSH